MQDNKKYTRTARLESRNRRLDVLWGCGSDRGKGSKLDETVEPIPSAGDI